MLTATLLTYCSFFKGDIRKDDFRMFLESSPGYPDLAAIVNALRYAGVDCKACKCTEANLKELISPFLLHIRSGKEESLMIARWNNHRHTFELYDIESAKWKSVSDGGLTRQWDGIVVYTEMPIVRSRIVKYLLCVTVILAIAGVYILAKQEILFQTLPMIVGCAVSIGIFVALHQKEKGIFSALCNISTVTDCKAVENSRFNAVYGISLDSMDLAYFCGQLLTFGVSFLLPDPYTVTGLYLFSAVVFLPVAGYSIYAQVKVGKICPLCLMVIMCLLWEGLAFLISGERTISIESILIPIIIWGVLFVFILIGSEFFIRFQREREKQMKERIKLLRLKRDRKIIELESVEVGRLFAPISLESKENKVRLTTILAPMCGHCKGEVREILQIRDSGLHFNWDILPGSIRRNDLSVIENWIACGTNNESRFVSELERWSKGNESFKDSVFSGEGGLDYRRVREECEEVIGRLGVSGYPRYILNGHLLSTVYTASDLKYLIHDFRQRN